MVLNDIIMTHWPPSFPSRGSPAVLQRCLRDDFVREIQASCVEGVLERIILEVGHRAALEKKKKKRRRTKEEEEKKRIGGGRRRKGEENEDEEETTKTSVMMQTGRSEKANAPIRCHFSLFPSSLPGI